MKYSQTTVYTSLASLVYSETTEFKGQVTYSFDCCLYDMLSQVHNKMQRVDAADARIKSIPT